MQRLRPFFHGGLPATTTAAAIRAGNGCHCASGVYARLRPVSQCSSGRPRRTIASSRLFSTSSSARYTTPAQPGVVSWSELTKEEEERKQRQVEEQKRRANGEATGIDTGVPQPPPTPGAALLESLAREPVVPRPANLSVLVEPAVEYEHRSETFHSRMRHGKSMFRQERLEVIRQAQLRPLPDWRVILQRLAAATPGKDDFLVTGAGGAMLAPRFGSAYTPPQFAQLYSSSHTPSLLAPLLRQQLPHQSGASASRPQGGEYRRDAVSLAFPGNSPYVQELLHGVDGTLWKISGRSGCILRLYRRDDGTPERARNGATDSDVQDSNDDHSWLLTLSGTTPSIYRAASEVNFFAKDAVPVAVSPNVRLDDRRVQQPSSRAPPEQLPPQTDGQAEPWPSEIESPATQTWSLVSSSYYLDDSKQHADYVFSPHEIDIGAHEIPQPAVWTRDTFERYVAALVNGRPPEQLAPTLYPQHSSWSRERTANDDDKNNDDNGEDTAATADTNPILNSHDRTVVDILDNLFNDDAVKHALSLSAFKLALTFISKHGETYRPEARALFVRAERLGMFMDTETFNILLASVVKTQDLRNFGSTLALMENRGHAPNLTTWVLFLRLFESEEVKRHILQAMHARGGLLDSPEALQCIAQEMVEYDAWRAISLHKQEQQKMKKQNQIYNCSPAVFFDGFMAGQAERYGPNWLTRPAANQILNVFASRGRFVECQELLGILTRKQGQRDHIEQLKVQQKQQQQQQPQSPHETFSILATQALNTTSFNIVLTHAKLQYKFRHALAIVRQMDAIDNGGAKNRSDQDQKELGQVEDQALVEAATPVTFTITRSSSGTRAVPADGTTYHLLHEMAFHRRMSYTMGAVWAFASIQRRTNHGMKKKAGRVLAGDTPPQTLHLAKVLRGEFESRIGHPGRDDLGSFASIGAAASARWAAYYDGWEPSVPLSQVLEEAMERDNALLRDRYDHDDLDDDGRRDLARRPPPPPLRIPLCRKLVTRSKKEGNNRSRGPEYNPDGGPAYVEIQPDWLPLKFAKVPNCSKVSSF